LSTGSPASQRGWFPRPILQVGLRYLRRYWYHPSSHRRRFLFLVCYATVTNTCLLDYSRGDVRWRCVFFLNWDVAGSEICCVWGMNARGYAVYISQEYYGVCVKCVWSVSSCTASCLPLVFGSGWKFDQSKCTRGMSLWGQRTKVCYSKSVHK